MRQIELRPGEEILIEVHKDQRLFPGEWTSYRLSTPVWGQDDGWSGNLLIELINRYGGGDLNAIGGDDLHIDFGAPEEEIQVGGKVIRVAPRYE